MEVETKKKKPLQLTATSDVNILRKSDEMSIEPPSAMSRKGKSKTIHHSVNNSLEVSKTSREETIADLLSYNKKFDVAKVGLLHLFTIVLVGCNDGILSGYMHSLIAIFTERGVPSQIRSFLNFTMLPIYLKVFVSPYIDKYFSNYFGRRKTYLIPCKIAAALFYFVMSFFIEELVWRKQILKISLSFLFLCGVLCFEVGALVGLRLEYFGKSNPGMIGAAYAMSGVLGNTIGMQLFTLLYSPTLCTNYLGYHGRIANHQKFMWGIAVLNLLSVILLFFIKEKTFNKSKLTSNLDVVDVFKACFGSQLIRKLIIIAMALPVILGCMKVTSMQYYIMKGLLREHVILITLFMVPIGFVANIMWVPFAKSGSLMRKTWWACTLAVVIEFLHIPNILFFDKNTNYVRTLIVYALILSIDVCCPWSMMQASMVNYSASPKYSSSYLTAFSTILSGARFIMILIVNPLIDYVDIAFMYGPLVVGQVIANIFLYKSALSLDSHNKEEYAKTFEVIVERLDPVNPHHDHHHHQKAHHQDLSHEHGPLDTSGNHNTERAAETRSGMPNDLISRGPLRRPIHSKASTVADSEKRF